MILQAEEVKFSYTDTEIIGGVTVAVNEGDRIGLVGDNGAGKTTLIRLLLGELTPDFGEVRKKKDLSVGYLMQNAGLDSERTVYDEMLTVFENAFSARNELEQVSHKMAGTDHNSADYKSIVSRYNYLISYIDACDGFNVEVKIKQVLNGMGFIEKYAQKVSSLSGGEKTRLAISKLLLESPELLILDEPTNHLDFATLTWLERYLSTYTGSIIVVSHDRYFLDKMINRVWELDDRTVDVYRGNYTEYKLAKSELLLFKTREYEKQSIKIAAMKEYAEKNIVRATTSKSAKSRLHQLENIEVLEKPKTYTKPPRFRFSFAEESAKIPLSVRDLTVYGGNKLLFDKVSFELQRGEKVAILGPNGGGKSTLLRKIVYERSREVSFGKYVRLGYYDQENSNLDFDKPLLTEVIDKYPTVSITTLRSILGAMKFTEDDMYKKIGLLSGGERAKLGLAVTTAENGNLLVLDEPTNHLDLLAREALEEALKAYEGTVLFVSHDRYFLNAVATKIFEISDFNLVGYVGNFDKYQEYKENEALLKAKEIEENERNKPIQKKAYRTAKDRSNEVATMKRIAELEEKISALEEEEAELNRQMTLPENVSDYKKLQSLCSRLDEVKREEEDAIAAWTLLA